MRWSLILSAFIAVQSALSFVSVALAIPSSSDGLLERRARRRAGPNLRSTNGEHRENAKEHPYAYHFVGLGPNGKITPEAKVRKTKLQSGKEREYGEKLINSQKGKVHADHVYEVQMVKKHLQNKGVHLNNLHPDLQKEIHGIINGKHNMAIIPASINQSKGQLIKHGMVGKQIKRKKARDDYAKESYTTAHETADKLDKAFKKHDPVKFGDHGFKGILEKTFIDAGLLHPHTGSWQTSPASSRSSSPNRRGKRKRSASPGNSPSKKKGKK